MAEISGRSVAVAWVGQSRPLPSCRVAEARTRPVEPLRAKASKPRQRLPENDAYSRGSSLGFKPRRKPRFGRRPPGSPTICRRLTGSRRAGTRASSSSRGGPGRGGHQGRCWSIYRATERCPHCMPLESGDWCAFDPQVTNPAQALFPSIREIYCLMVLLTCERGFNLSVMNNLTVHSFTLSDPVSEESIHTVEVDETAAQSGTTLKSSPVTRARLWDTAVRITQPCRDTFGAGEHPATGS